MGKLIYSMITSIDGFVSDPAGNFGWGCPEEEVHEFVNEQFRSIGTNRLPAVERGRVVTQGGSWPC